MWPQLAGIIPFSATDWPGRLTVTAFTQGCPLACRYCHNPALRPMRPGRPFAEVFPVLEERRGLVDALVISGGEPLSQPGLGEAIAAVHERGFPVGLHTSGYRAAAVRTLLQAPETTPDWVGLDVKALPEDCVRLFGMSPRAAQGCWESLAALREAGVPVQVRTTVWPAFTDHLPELEARVAEYGCPLVVQRARGVDAQGYYTEDDAGPAA
ncbi:anaerobic ribonucleoside-triphosphate reductase activating protein [Micrococcus sp.]|uniref:anaerobic ribonucleoside-triphosphate reductase activating protein n=1 Tax=Micrococcus sp. TaxID=1271 RepID=UPI002A91A1DC|nr:anaerobic ribonucleoside-triphosphate reductase activating protein [Micrococcus sp.]MDY6054758.1 anaerobic ribonucleoside-triphosphate reductase activating protein [Micrococcus sp.]